MTETFVKDVTLDTARRTLKNKHNIKVTKAKLCEFLQDPKATHIGKDDIERFVQARKGEVEADDVQPAVSDVPAEPDQPQVETPSADEPTKPLREAVAMLVEANVKVSVAQAAAFLGVSLDSQITIDQFKMLGNEFRGSEIAVIEKRPGRFGRVATKIRNTRRKPTRADLDKSKTFWAKVQKVWAGEQGEPQKVRVERAGYLGHRDVLVSERIIELPLNLYRELEAAGELPIVHDDTIAELTADLASLSLFHTHGTYCGQPLHIHYEGLVRRILSRQLMPPLVRLGRNQQQTRKEKERLGLTEAVPFIFYEEHRACQMKGGLVDMMSNVEPEFSGAETPAKDAQRVARYMEELRKIVDPESGKTMLQKILESEAVFDHSIKRLRSLTARELFERMRAININLNKNQEGVA